MIIDLNKKHFLYSFYYINHCLKSKIDWVTVLSNINIPSQYFQISNGWNLVNLEVRTKVHKREITTIN